MLLFMPAEIPLWLGGIGLLKEAAPKKNGGRTGPRTRIALVGDCFSCRSREVDVSQEDAMFIGRCRSDDEML